MSVAFKVGSFLLGVFQDTVGNPRGTSGAVFFLHDGQRGRSVDLRNVVVVFQGPIGKRSFEVRLDCHPFVMHVLHTWHGIHGNIGLKWNGFLPVTCD